MEHLDGKTVTDLMIFGLMTLCCLAPIPYVIRARRHIDDEHDTPPEYYIYLLVFMALVFVSLAIDSVHSRDIEMQYRQYQSLSAPSSNPGFS